MIISTCDKCGGKHKTETDVTFVGLPPTPPNYCAGCGGKYIHERQKKYNASWGNKNE